MEILVSSDLERHIVLIISRKLGLKHVVEEP